MVEAALITPVFLLIVIGILEFGLAFKDQLGVNSAVRAGARLASAEPRVATFATDAAAQVALDGSALDLPDVSSLWVYQADSTGHPIGAGGTFSSCSQNCIEFTWNAATNAFVQSGGSWPATSEDACQGSQDSIGVYLDYKHQAVTDLFFTTLNLSSYSVMRLEPVPSMQAGGCS